MKFFKIPGGGFVCRFGDRKFNAGTVGHQHFQIQVPDGTGPVKVTLFKSDTPEDRARRAKRLQQADGPATQVTQSTPELEADARQVSHANLAVDQGWSEVEAFLDKDGRYLNEAFAWTDVPYYWAMFAGSNVREVLRRNNQLKSTTVQAGNLYKDGRFKMLETKMA